MFFCETPAVDLMRSGELGRGMVSDM